MEQYFAKNVDPTSGQLPLANPKPPYYQLFANYISTYLSSTTFIVTPRSRRKEHVQPTNKYIKYKFYVSNKSTRFYNFALINVLCIVHIAVNFHQIRNPSRKLPKSVTLRRGQGQLGLLRGSRLFNVTDFGTNRKLMCDFLLVINSNLPPILHRFRDIASQRYKIAKFFYHSLV